MMAGHRKLCWFTASYLWGVVAFNALFPPAVAKDITLVDAYPGYVTLYLDVMVNRAKIADVVPVYQKDNILYLDQAGINAVGLERLSSPEPLVALNSLPGVTVNYQASTLTLALQVPTQALKHVVYDNHDPRLTALPSEPSLPGVLLNYNLYATTAPDSASNLWTNMRALGGDNRSLTNSMQTAWRRDGLRNTRLDTAFQQDFPERVATLTVGDTVTSALDWTRSTRIGGVRLSRNFALTPYQTTAPMAVFTGSAVMPSNIDVYVNNIRQSSQAVSPGDFTVSGIPLQDGQGNVAMVMTDINGKKSTYTYDVYGANPLLQAHLLDASLEGGVVRNNWGTANADYTGVPMVSGSLRYGVTDALTAESHLESSRQVQQVGLGSRWLAGERFGVLQASVAASHAATVQSGWGSLWGYHWQARTWQLSFTSAYNSASFRDVASESTGGVTLLRRSQQVFVGVNTDEGNISVGLIGQTDASNTQNRYANLTWSRQWGQGNYSISFNHQAGASGDNNIMLSGSIALSRRLTLNSTVTAGRHPGWVNGLSQRSMYGDGLEWQVQQARYAQGLQNNQAEVRYVHPKGDTALGIVQSHGNAINQTAAYGIADGSLALLPAGVFMARNTGEAFTLVSTNGVAQVPVMLENNMVGKTDAHGYYFLGNLTPYQRNRISIDATNIPEDYSVGQTARETVPMRSNGTLSWFALLRHTVVQLRVQDVTGKDMPVSSRVSWRSGGREQVTQVGYDGLVYLQDPEVNAPLRIVSGTLRCRVSLSPELIRRAGQTPQPVSCHLDNAEPR
ncbi:fimbria/pilus outer membrane usher protein [Serratia marcescens]|uniref:fimbria/pilus outer membrane usher protein n=1 Tax=Serratia marcescens TaxID=615 RepID=UPI000E3C8238|nr:fimbria/pilus outer membrane usher protein [Serratia marcescens]RFT78344.1 fimbrial biogenesis outer membrane usher protein [Serratia marcescens]TFZ82631.1 fimbrial biogenesis outer membrane usher protein [Serratia marcescens]